ncbi:MAG TPA: AraC family transcriptional regulator, partial [Burkholderiales bacterium]
VVAQELLIGRKSLAAVAAQVGYDSEAAFNRAFKREFGMPLAGWRKNRSKADVAGTPAKAMQPAGETTVNA